jgi:hypothetical protein
MATRGRKKTPIKCTNTIFGYLSRPSDEPKSICKGIVEYLIGSFVNRSTEVADSILDEILVDMCKNKNT